MWRLRHLIAVLSQIPKPNLLRMLAVIMNEQLEKKLDPLVSKDDDRAESNSMTFSYRELATATNNFRHESLIGEGGFGAVYKGKLETTDQVIVSYQPNILSLPLGEI